MLPSKSPMAPIKLKCKLSTVDSPPKYLSGYLVGYLIPKTWPALNRCFTIDFWILLVISCTTTKDLSFELLNTGLTALNFNSIWLFSEIYVLCSTDAGKKLVEPLHL